MATPAELTRQYTDLEADELAHLQNLLGSWSILADLSFSDLLLVVPRQGGSAAEAELVVLGQIRPNNASTLLANDLVGGIFEMPAWSIHAPELARGQKVLATFYTPRTEETYRAEYLPVCFGGRLLGAIVRVLAESDKGQGTERIPLYGHYIKVFERLVTMLADSTFPFSSQNVGAEETPRVGDGFVLVDEEIRVVFASPNAVNAFHRMGVFSSAEGRRVDDLARSENLVSGALKSGRPIVEEVERAPGVVVLIHAFPLIENDHVNGGVVLLRDVTDVRRLDRLLVSKDAAIREVHHRVKNNLQTISSLLSLQARRVADAEGGAALREAERRVRSIALVHEILSRDPRDQVAFGEIMNALVAMARDSVVVSYPVEITVEGDLGELPAEVATPLSVILAEVLQNAVEHAFVKAATPPPGHVEVSMEANYQGRYVTVKDDGVGLDPGFDINNTPSLGLAIVRDLVRSQLGGAIQMINRAGGGTEVTITLPVSQA
jgi:two-component sensor histidine kinase